MKIETFSSGGGCYHAEGEWENRYLVVDNESMDVITMYEDSDMEIMIDSWNIADLKGSPMMLGLHKELVNKLIKDFPNISYKNINGSEYNKRR